MDYKKIDVTDLEIVEEPFIINKEVSFYTIKYDSDKLKFKSPTMKSYTGIKTNTFDKDEINLTVNDDFKKFIRELEEQVQKQFENIYITETKEFKSILHQYKEYPEFIKPTINKFTKYKTGFDYKNQPLSVILTVTGVWINQKNYGISLKLNRIDIE